MRHAMLYKRWTGDPPLTHRCVTNSTTIANLGLLAAHCMQSAGAHYDELS